MALLLGALIFTYAPCVHPAAASPLAVFGYLPEWRLAGADYNSLARVYSPLAFFSVEPNADGGLAGYDRQPSGESLADARTAAAVHGTQLLVCAGGNGRSTHFGAVTRSVKRRARFVNALVSHVRALGLDGVDLNWEYPGYAFGKGWASDAEVRADFGGLARLARDLRKALPPGSPLTLAYYPDGRQEVELYKSGVWRHVDFMHAMTYDANGPDGHSPLSLAHSAFAHAAAAGLPPAKLTLGLPFYGRHSRTGDWTTYEDIVQQHHPLAPDANSVPAAPNAAGVIDFNGADLIEEKVRVAAAAGWGGVMVWEAGQDCRLSPVTRDGRTHARTCPAGAGGSASSLLVAIARALAKANASHSVHAWLRELNVPVAPGAVYADDDSSALADGKSDL